MIETYLLAGAMLGMIFFALWGRIKNNRRKYQGERSESVIASPLTEALGQLVGIAGGIYVALVMVLSFLGVEEVGKVALADCLVDPLAFLAVALACLQPIGIYLLHRFHN